MPSTKYSWATTNSTTIASVTIVDAAIHQGGGRRPFQQTGARIGHTRPVLDATHVLMYSYDTVRVVAKEIAEHQMVGDLGRGVRWGTNPLKDRGTHLPEMVRLKGRHWCLLVYRLVGALHPKGRTLFRRS